MTEYELEKQECLSTPLVTVADAEREYVFNVGCEDDTRPWICSDRDVWYRNPFYSGPPVQHPEEDYYED